MRNLLQVRLQTIFLLFFCAAVGLTTSTSPLGAIESAIQVAIVIGLLQQARQLLSCQTPDTTLDSELLFARRFAIFWRVAVSSILGSYLIWALLLAKQLVASSDPGEFLILNPIGDGLSQLCVLIALCNSRIRWRSAAPVVEDRAIRVSLMWVVGIAMAMIMIVEGTTIEYLVHNALHGVEMGQKPQFRRTGLYVQLSAEGYDAIWYGLGAVACLLGGLALTTHLRIKNPRHYVQRLVRKLLYLLLLAPSIVFCIWYYCDELYRLSPDMAGVGLALARFDLLIGVLLAATIVTVGAYGVGAKFAPQAIVSDNLSSDLDRNALHESFLCLLLLAIHASGTLFYLTWEIVKYDPMIGTLSVGRFISFFCYPSFVLGIATFAATVQLCWVRWKKRSQIVPWKLNALSPRSFTEGWIMLALLVVVGIPTVKAFAFLLWLGPYNLLQLFGL